MGRSAKGSRAMSAGRYREFAGRSSASHRPVAPSRAPSRASPAPTMRPGDYDEIYDTNKSKPAAARARGIRQRPTAP